MRKGPGKPNKPKMGNEFVKRKISRKDPQKLSDGSATEQKQMLPNSLVMRVLEDPKAEKEADRLSRGVTSVTPDALREEMGSRLGLIFRMCSSTMILSV